MSSPLGFIYLDYQITADASLSGAISYATRFKIAVFSSSAESRRGYYGNNEPGASLPIRAPSEC
jgi:hypothetical protein